MRRLLHAAFLIALLLAAARTEAPVPVYAEPLPEETRKLLEKSLSLVEIDREIGRISSLRQETETKIGESERKLAAQEIAVTMRREKAGRVLRAYYMGRNELILGAFLNAESLTDLLRTWDTMDMIIRSDRQTLDKYTVEYNLLRQGYERLKQDKTELAGVERDLKAQRERLLALQAELDRALASSGDEQHLRQMMSELEAYWNNIGLFEVRRTFRALSEAMQGLPEWIRDHPDTLERSGLKAKLTLTDAGLNDFLKSRNDLFRHFSIRFEQDRMTLSGADGSVKVAVGGHYSLQDKPENAIRFHVDSLVFNGFDLPDTTRADLEREFDLGFYPQKLIAFIKAQSVKLEPGRLIVQLEVG